MARSTRILSIASALALALTGAVAALPAAASTLVCGQSIDQDTVLTQDLECTSGDALRIVADGVTLDLKGYTIRGPGWGLSNGTGVRVSGRSGVTVTNGTITGFQYGVTLDTTTGATVSKVRSVDNFRGFDLANARGSLVEKNHVSGSIHSDGIRLGHAHDSVIAKNTLEGNTWGISVLGTNGSTIEKNTVTASRSTGIAVFDGSAGTTLEKNVVSLGWNEGIRTSGGASGTIVLKNEAFSNGGHGITVSDAIVTKNTATLNGGLGILAMNSTDGGGNLAAGNGNPAECVGVVCTAP